MIKTQPVADRGGLANRVKNKLSQIAIRTLRAPYFYPDPHFHAVGRKGYKKGTNFCRLKYGLL